MRKYQWRVNDDKTVIPDASVICNMRDQKMDLLPAFHALSWKSCLIPQKNITGMKKCSCTAKSAYRNTGLLTGVKKQVEIYMFDWKDDDTSYPYLYKTITEKNKDDSQLVMFPNFRITFDELFDIE